MYIYRCTSFYISTYIYNSTFIHIHISPSYHNFQNVLLFLLIYLQGVPINLFESFKMKKYTKYLNAIICMYSVFFIGLKVFVHLTHLKLLQIGQTYLKFFVWLEHLIKIHLEYHKKYF